MDKTTAVIVFSIFGLYALITGVVVLVRKQNFVFLKREDFFGRSVLKVSGKAAKSESIRMIAIGLFLLGLATAIHFWGG